MQKLVRFACVIALNHMIRQLYSSPVNSFEFQSCDRILQAAYFTR